MSCNVLCWALTAVICTVLCRSQVPTFPAPSWLWSEITYPSFGALIDSRRLLLKLQSSAALLLSGERVRVLVRLLQVRDLEYAATVDTLDTLGQTAIEPGEGGGMRRGAAAELQDMHCCYCCNSFNRSVTLSLRHSVQ